jgi:hypothetical protein
MGPQNIQKFLEVIAASTKSAFYIIFFLEFSCQILFRKSLHSYWQSFKRRGITIYKSASYSFYDERSTKLWLKDLWRAQKAFLYPRIWGKLLEMNGFYLIGLFMIVLAGLFTLGLLWHNPPPHKLLLGLGIVIFLGFCTRFYKVTGDQNLQKILSMFPAKNQVLRLNCLTRQKTGFYPGDYQ